MDDWSWRKGSTYGTIMVDLERREVLDVLRDRSAESTASWLACHPTIEIVSRDRCGLFAQGAAQGAPQASQVANRLHLLQNLRHAIEQQLTRAPDRHLQLALQEIVVLAIRRSHPPLWAAGGDGASLSCLGGTPWPGATRVRSRQGAARRRQDAGHDRPRDRVQLAHGPEVDTAGRIPAPGDHGAEDHHAGRLRCLPGAALERWMHDGAAAARGDPPAWLHGQPDPPAAASEQLAPGPLRGGARRLRRNARWLLPAYKRPPCPRSSRQHCASNRAGC
ncbi:hypothetical protein HN018_26690 (plasmid) [Lichenicola cladoniae]|uniref:Transposase IS204/IS1001/IS1096/IS1165 DDE domain-containing protein n=1 Tax=Lichenicola cladoniae TaxID=1484109 RepID=A0A6M8I0F8_9PROT|nr:hypothetical protein [Acetobacteraceae bacterium]QKE93721.1 hypothetical protein HN018_26690 [Lichenicola cladoniae]